MAEIDPLAFQKGFQATQNIFDNAQRNRLQDLAMQRAEEAYQQDQTANRLYAAAVGPDGTVDRTKLVTGYAQGGLGSKIPALQTTFSAQDKAQNEARKAQLENGLKQFEAMGQLFSGVQDQASYDAARQQAASIIGPEAAARIPAQYDPQQIAQGQAQALSVKDRMAQELQRITVGETMRHNRVTEATALAGQDLTRRGQDLSADTTRRGQDMASATAAANREATAGKAGAKEAEAQRLRTQDANDALGLLDQAEKLIPGATGSYLGAGRDMALRSIGAATDAGNAAAQLRALEGALVSKMPKMSGPQSDKDVAMYRQMAGQIGDPTVPSETKLAAIKTIREIQNRYAGNAAPAAPVAGAPVAQDAAIQELRRRAASDPALAAKLKAMGY